MGQYSISHDYLEIVSGANSRYAKAYLEAAKQVEQDTTKAMGKLKSFITSMEKVSSKGRDHRITESKGNIESISSYDDIKTVINFLSKNLGSLSTFKNLKTIYDALENNKSEYMDGYNHNIRLIILEYESAAYLLITGLSMVMSTNIQISHDGKKIKIGKKSGQTHGIISKTISDMASQLSVKSHRDYLKELIKTKDKNGASTKSIKENTSFMEGSVTDTLTLVDDLIKSVGKLGTYTKAMLGSLKRSVFGIVPLIRTGLYLHYKKKADTILALEEQAEFIRRNIEQLQNMTNMDPKKKEHIIKMQQAYVEAYMKKAEKLRAELTETERETAQAVASDNKKIQSDDDDFVLEGVGIFSNFFPKRVDRKSPTKNRSISNDDIVLADNIIRSFEQSTRLDNIELVPVSRSHTDDDSTRIISKLGGKPYWPNNMKWPIDIKSKPAIMVAQINFSEISHNIHNLPTSGILQLFTSQYVNSGTIWCKCIYHENIDTDDIIDEFPITTLDKNLNEDFPIRWMSKFNFELSHNNPMFNDISFNRCINEIISSETNRQYNSMQELPRYVSGSIHNASEELNKGTHMIGGYPKLYDKDPRPDESWKLLFQIVSDEHIDWFDYGSLLFFIKESDLVSKNFDNVLIDLNFYDPEEG